MIKMYRKNEQLFMQFFGQNFTTLLNIMKKYRLKFVKGDEYKIGVNDYWVLPPAPLYVLNDLKDIEDFELPKKVENYCREPETEYFHIKYNPELLKVPPLADFQKNAIAKGAMQSRLALFLKQGLGKTYVVVGILNHLFSKKLVDKVLVCCRPEGVYNFKNEILRFNTFGLTKDDIYIVDPEHRDPFNTDCKVVISKYQSFAMICKDALPKGKTISARMKKSPIDLSQWGKGRALILDESHSCKNRTAQITQCLMKESVFFRFRYLLTGTPYPKGIDELWSQFQILDKGIINSDYYSFLNRVAKLGNNFSQYAISYYKRNEVEKFVDSIKPWVVREFTDDNFKMPELIKQNIYVKMSDVQRQIYQKFISYRMESIMQGTEAKLVLREVCNDFPHIQQAITDPTLLKGKLENSDDEVLKKLVSKFKFEDNERYKVCLSLIEDEIEKGRRIILWSGHPITIMNLEKCLSKYNPICIHGLMNKLPKMNMVETTAQYIDEFKKNEKHKILIASYNMISTSANIAEAQTSIYWDRPWDFSQYEQSLSRNRRADGSFSSVYTYNIIEEETIENIQDIVLSNRERLDKILLKVDTLSMSEYKKLFSGKYVVNNENH